MLIFFKVITRVLHLPRIKRPDEVRVAQSHRGGDVMPLLLCTAAVSHPRASSAGVSPVSGTLHLTANGRGSE